MSGASASCVLRRVWCTIVVRGQAFRHGSRAVGTPQVWHSAQSRGPSLLSAAVCGARRAAGEQRRQQQRPG